MAVRPELRLCRRFPLHLHPLQVLTPAAAFSSGPRPSAGSHWVLCLRSGTSWAPSPGLFISATVSDEEPPEAGLGPEPEVEQPEAGPGPGPEEEPPEAGPGPEEEPLEARPGPGPGPEPEEEQPEAGPGPEPEEEPREAGPGPEVEPPEAGPGPGPEEEQPEAAPRGQVTGAPLRIYTSKLFPKHYGLWMEECVEEEPQGLRDDGLGPQACLRVSVVHSVPTLTKVVLGARTRASLCWAGSHNFANGLLLLICQQQQILLRQGDVPIIPYHPLFGEDSTEVFTNLMDLVVLECQPVLQGVLDVNTSLVLTEFKEPGQLPCTELQPLKLLQPLCVSDFAHYTSGVWGTGFGMEHGKPLDSDIMTFLRALECRLEATVMDVPALLDSGKLRPRAVAGQPSGLDADNLLVLTKPALQRLGLFNHEWVLVSLLELAVEREQRAMRAELDMEQPSQRQDPGASSSPDLTGGSPDQWLHGRLASVVVVDVANGAQLELAENTAAISHTLWFNVSKGAPIPITSRTLKIKRFYQTSGVSKQPKDSRSALSVPPLAKELHVKVIVSPTYNARAVYDGLLFEHFKTPRLIHSGDVLCVRTRGKAEFIENCSERLVRWPVLYLKVSSVSGHTATDPGPGFLADSEHTSLYLDGCVNSFIPAAAASNSHQFWGSTSPPGLTDTVDILAGIMQPYLRTGPPVLDWPCSVLLWGPSGCGKTTVLQAACSKFNLHLVKVDCASLSADSTGASEAKLQAAFAEAEIYCPCIVLLHNLSMIGRISDGVDADSRLISSLHRFMKDLSLSCNEYPVVVVGTVGRLQDLFADVQTLFLHDLGMESLSEDQRKLIMAALSTELPLGRDVNLAKLAKLTAGYLLSDLCALLNQASHAACSRLKATCFPGAVLSVVQELDLCTAGVTILWEDFQTALDHLQNELSQAIGAPKIPAVRWQDVGGLQEVKHEILDTVQLPLDHPELLTLGLRRTGLLLYGPPGTGKTMLAKAIATECAMTFLSVKGPELINMYVGQSEENVREVFLRARAAAPCVIFFDELDSLAPNRGRSGDSGGVMDRVVSQLLAELDGLQSCPDVFVIGATNRPDLLDRALLRPGRLEKLLYVGVSEDRDAQLRILRAITRRFTLHSSVSLSHVVSQCPPYLSGADLYSLCSDAMMVALKRKINHVQQGLDTENSELVLMPDDFQKALAMLQPSVSQQELFNYKLIQQRLSAT